MNESENQTPNVPQKFRATLQNLGAPEVVVPLRVEETILRAAREHLAGARTAGAAMDAVKPSRHDPSETANSGWAQLCAGVMEFFGRRRFAAWGGVAVAIVAVGGLVWLGGHPRVSARPEDLNGDGVVDMLDAFALARELQHDPASHPQLDFNKDGVVDERDVRTLAAIAVSLEQGGRS